MAQKQMRIGRKFIVVMTIAVGLTALTGTAYASYASGGNNTAESARCGDLDARIARVDGGTCSSTPQNVTEFAPVEQRPAQEPTPASVDPNLVALVIGLAALAGAVAGVRSYGLRHAVH